MTTEQTNERGIQSKPIIDANMLQLRLSTQDLIEQVESYLRGGRIVIRTDQDGKIITEEIIYGKQKANKLGIQSILAWMQQTINPHTVQGNFPVDKHGFSLAYENYISEYQCRLGDVLVLNCYDWGIKDEEIEGIIDSIMLLVQPFFSRLIGNKERESYADTLRSVETNTNKSGGFSFLK